ncbi:MAG TPA: AAA family ATPase [Bryobacteraceae bacterium]|nr:AAA family ATPase [Bryobacteraceae bacterium]
MADTIWPAWAQDLSEKYFSGAYVQFILHGNVHDLVPLRRNGSVEFLSLKDFLHKGLFGQRQIVFDYDRGGGLSFATTEMQADFRSAVSGYDAFHGTAYAAGLPRNPDGVMNILDNYLRLRLLDNRKIAFSISFAETVAPAGDPQSLSAEDRNALVILKRWAQNPVFLRQDVTICLIAENILEVNQSIVQHPGVASVAIGLPDAVERQEFIEWQIRQTPLPEGSDVTAVQLAALTSGLKRLQLQGLLAHAHHNRFPLTAKELGRRKREMIEAESGGMLEFVQSRFTLANVSGSAAAKQMLSDAATAIRAGRSDVVPMGYVLCGPVGTGKTFLATCFAGDVGIPAVVLKNFRSMWQGQTEANLQRVLALLKAMSPIMVIVDEADAQLGDRNAGGDSGVSGRVFAQIAQFMGNTENRGKVIWFLLTCRPDLLPVDLKRQGRAEEHLALFYPDTDEDRLAMLRAMMKKTGIQLASPAVEKLFLEKAGSMSGADIEAILVRASMKSALEKEAAVDADDLVAVLEDFLPPSYPAEIELQTLIAVAECTRRSLLPEKYRAMKREEIAARLAELRLLTGE